MGKIVFWFFLTILLVGCGKEKQVEENIETTQKTMQENETVETRENTKETVPEQKTEREYIQNDTSVEVQDAESKKEVVYMHSLYVQFLKGEITVTNPFTQGMEDSIQELSFFDDEQYDGEFEYPEKSFALQDMNGDDTEELIFRIEESPSELIYILGIVEDELVCFDVFETHTSNMGYTVYDNGYVWFGCFDEEEEYYTFDSEGKPTDIHKAEHIEFAEEDELISVAWTPCEDVICKEEAKQVEIDYYAFEKVMTSKEWQAFSEYIPVLEGKEDFYWQDGWNNEQRGKISLLGFYAEALPMYEEPDYRYEIEEVAVIDLDDDGIIEVVLSGLYPGGHYLVLHKEGTEFYGIDFVYRGFLTLQTNGVYTASSGASLNCLCKLFFREGVFVENVLGEMLHGIYPNTRSLSHKRIMH